MDLMGKQRSLKFSTLVQTVLLLLFCGASGTHCSMVHGNMTDRRSLLDFKEAVTDDPTGALRDWNDSIHHCRWSGVSCSRRHPGRVTALKLYDLNLTGQITPSIGNLSFLRELNLETNRFSGQLPFLNHLRKLNSLYLYNNILQGNISDALIALLNCSKLEYLDLSDNMLEGSIPRNIGSLSNLLAISISGNNLTGNIPLTFSNITHLEYILISDNQLEGNIPEEFGQLPDMSWVQLDRNMLSGHIPDSLGNASKMRLIDLSSNYFTGQIPSYLGKLHKLQYLMLDKNKLEARDSQSWEFLDALSNCPGLHILSLSGNQLHGVLPNSVGNLSTTLRTLDLGANNLCGTVPLSIGALKNLEYLHLGGNNFVGTIPYSIGNLANLRSSIFPIISLTVGSA